MKSEHVLHLEIQCASRSKEKEKIGDRGAKTRRFRLSYSFIFLVLLVHLFQRLDVSSLRYYFVSAFFNDKLLIQFLNTNSALMSLLFVMDNAIFCKTIIQDNERACKERPKRIQ